MTKIASAGDAVEVIVEMNDPRIKHGIKGVDCPMFKAVYTVESIYPGADGVPRYLLVGVRSRGTDANGQPVLIGWHPSSFKVLRDVNVAGIISKALSVMTVKEEQQYSNDYHTLLREADAHRKAKY